LLKLKQRRFPALRFGSTSSVSGRAFEALMFRFMGRASTHPIALSSTRIALACTGGTMYPSVSGRPVDRVKV
jgi:hypothetical protein